MSEFVIVAVTRIVLQKARATAQYINNRFNAHALQHLGISNTVAEHFIARGLCKLRCRSTEYATHIVFIHHILTIHFLLIFLNKKNLINEFSHG